MNRCEGLPPGFEMIDTLIDLLTWRAQQHPEKLAYTFLVDGEEEAVSLSYEDLYRQARAIGGWLQERMTPGDRVLLMQPFGLEYITCFWGCLLAGGIVVPAYPPSPNRPTPRIDAILHDAQVTVICTSVSMQAAMEKHSAVVAEGQVFHWFTHDLLTPELYERWQAPIVTSDSLALLQYTSGSTAVPKGVMVTHGNLLHNSLQIYRILEHDADSHIVSWLPFFHDMGLLLGLMQPVFADVPVTLLSATAFLQRPVRWLQALSRTKASVSAAPNFAYELCAQKVLPEQQEGLDLSNLKSAVNGSEPVRYQTLKRFASAFASSGLRWEHMRPGYGMAENTLVATMGKKETEPLVLAFKDEALQLHQALKVAPGEDGARLLVSCGYPRADQQLLIVNPENLVPCTEGQIGEIWLAGPSTAKGYWHKPDETRQTFQAYHTSSQEWGDGPWLRTGDLGFLEQGELFITGRLKDMIIINGRNYYPQDIEQSVVESHPAARQDCTVAFSLDVENEEKLIIVQEVERAYRHTDLREVIAAMRHALSEHYDLHAYAIILIKPASMPKTTSGKVQRRGCRNALLSQELAILHADIPSPLASQISQHTQNASIPQKQHAPEAVQVVARDSDGIAESASRQPMKDMQFSLLYFSSNEETSDDDKYHLLVEGTRFADRNGFTAVWLPERHFHPFGGLYPNPSVLASALAMITQNIRLRAGSVVLPLHHPLRVVEEWSVVDNLSQGRVDLAFATGWNVNDFVLAPTHYAERKEETLASIRVVQELWEGKSLSFPNGKQQATPTRVYPLPRQKTLVPWLTCTGSLERFKEAGAMGLNVLTGLLFQSVEELGEKITAYRMARAQHGYDPETGHVTLMMHTFIHDSLDIVREKVRAPFTAYLESSVNLWRHGKQKLDQLTVAEREKLLAYSFERYFRESALFATPQTGMAWVERLQAVGVNEIACLLDFGVDDDSVLSGLYALNALRKRCQAQSTAKGSTPLITGSALTSEKKPPLSLPDREVDILGSQVTREGELIGASGVPFQLKEIVEQVQTASKAQRLALIRQYLLLQLALLLRKPLAEIEHVKDLKDLGMDSLMVVDIIGHCQNDFHVSLDPVQFYERSILDKLTEYIVVEIDRVHVHIS
ncbi:MupA/Atu3671 family FMN-dependent luciferase-like monooxygenase [Ktedonobacter robiniae]|nr:MupA/Atu3671 family FMN-dependent luciferase-like monooxygenase [Ktedonobacter robiniae]